MSAMLCGLQGVLCLTDNVLIYGQDQEEHDRRLEAVLQRIQSAGVTLNSEKCEFSKDQLKFLGHIIDKDGVRGDPAKIQAVLDLPPPSNVPQMRQFVGMINQLAKFLQNCASIIHPLTELLSSKRAWQWGPSQEEAFVIIKKTLTEPTVLTLYDPSAATKISADASSYGIGAVLLQKHQDHWKPVVYASRTLTETERHYAQIEKEGLSLTWACDKFSPYIIGKTIELETDHKPLVPLLSSKNLDAIPPRILRFRLRLMRYSFTISHVPGKCLYTADILSRSPLLTETDDSESGELERVTELFISTVVSHLPAIPNWLKVLITAQLADKSLQQVMQYCREKWPEKRKITDRLKPFWFIRNELSVHNNLLLRGNRIVIPQQEMLGQLHEGHQGIVKC